MIRLGSRWSLAWKHPHRIEATVTALTQEEVVVDSRHRCDPLACELQRMRRTLPLDGEMRFRYRDFTGCFVPMAEDAIPLPSGQTL